MIIKYKDKEYNIELSVNSLIELKNKCYNNEFYFLFKYLTTIDEFSKWFYSEYKDYKEFMQYPNRCRICGKHSKIEFCREHQKTKEFYEYSSKKARQTMLERYGSENYNVLQTKKAIKEKYGVDNISQVEEINNKIRKTKALQNHKEINEKRKNTCLKKYGIGSIAKLESTKSKTKNTNLEKYGKEYYTQTDEYKLSNKQTWNSKTTEELENIKKKRENTNALKSEEEKIKLRNKLSEIMKNKNHEEINEKREKTNLEKYGVKNPLQNTDIKNKMESTKLEKYGNKNFVNPKKISETYQNKSIDEKTEIIENIKQTNIKKYGVDNVFKSKIIKEKIKQTKFEKYGNENYNNSEKIKQTNLEKYGVMSIKQLHFKNVDDLNDTFIKQKFIKDNRFLIQDFMEYFNFSYKTAMFYKSKFNILTQNKINIAKTQQFIFDNIKTENKIFNDRIVLDGKELDIYLPDFNLAIEYNGLMYHSEGCSDIPWLSTTDKNYHLDKTNQCLDKGIQLFHIFEGENLDLWLSMINNKLGLNERIFARKCEIRELSNKDIINFLNDNHIQGYVQSKINLGLFFQNKLVSVMTFSKPRFNKRYQYELIRFCSLKNTSVIGSANKLLKYFINKYNPKSIISYANRRFSNGSIYETLGFKKIGVSAPNYFYFKDSLILESRNKYQKHKLKSLLPEFDENLSESENMFKNGYRRIYDCGNLIYELVL